ISLSGFVAERLSFFRTLLVQVAGSFVTLVTPAAVGGAALNIRYLQRRKIPAAVAAASVGVAQVVAFVLHIALIVVFAAVAGSSAKEHIQPPQWAWYVLAGLVVLALAVLAVPAGRCAPGCPRRSARCCRGCSTSRSSRSSWRRASAARCCSACPTSCVWRRASRRSAGPCRSPASPWST